MNPYPYPCHISSNRTPILRRPFRKFGKQIQRRQLDLPEYAASFFNYKALKKVGLVLYNPHSLLTLFVLILLSAPSSSSN